MSKSLGSSTLCIATARVGAVQLFNLGDSGAKLLRVGADPATSKTAAMRAWGVAAETKEQTHYFNCPYQMGCAEAVEEADLNPLSAPIHDPPSDGSVVDMPVRPGDVLVLATDGVWDNLFERDVLDLARGLDAGSIAALAEHELQRSVRVRKAIKEGSSLAEAARQAGREAVELEEAVKTTCRSLAAGVAVRSQARGARETGESPF